MNKIFIDMLVNCSSQIMYAILAAAFSILLRRFTNSERIRHWLTIISAVIIVGLIIFVISNAIYDWRSLIVVVDRDDDPINISSDKPPSNSNNNRPPKDEIKKVDEIPIQDGKIYTIENVAEIKPLTFWFIDKFRWYEYSDFAPSVFDDASDRKFNEYFGREHYQYSGSDAEFVWMLAQITNLSKQPRNFASGVDVSVIYKNSYEYDGCVRQAYIYENVDMMTNYYTDSFPFVCFRPNMEKSIQPMYKGSYVFVCKLPNAIVSEDKTYPLRMIIKIDGKHLVYDLRKQ